MDAHTLKPATTLAKHAKTPFPGGSAEYLKAREALLAEEIEFRRHMTRLTEQRRALPPGPVIEKNYRFKDANGAEPRPPRPVRQARHAGDLLLDAGPQRERPCPMCTNWLGAVNGNAADIKQRVAFKVLGRSTVATRPISPRYGRSSTSRQLDAGPNGIRSWPIETRIR